jgi:hypothetical protein
MLANLEKLLAVVKLQRVAAQLSERRRVVVFFCHRDRSAMDVVV